MSGPGAQGQTTGTITASGSGAARSSMPSVADPAEVDLGKSFTSRLRSLLSSRSRWEHAPLGCHRSAFPLA